MSKQKELNLPNEEALLRVLARNNGFAAELIIRLAWQAGLSRPQIQDLTWDQVSFEKGEILLPNRAPIPIHPDLLTRLQQQRNRPSSKRYPYVVLTDCHHTHPEVVQISKIAGKALAEEETLKGINLKDLRDDFIVRAIQQHGKAYAIRISGISMATIYSTYGQYLSQSRGTVVEGDPSKNSQVDENRLLQLLTAEGNSAAAMALWLVWKQGMTLDEITRLTWDQVDFQQNEICRENDNGKTTLHPIVAQLLKEAFDSRGLHSDPHVLLSPKAQRPFDPDRLCVLTRTALIRGGLDSLYLNKLVRIEPKDKMVDELLQYMAQRRFVTQKEVTAALKLNKSTVYHVLHQAVNCGKIVRIGTRYYKAGTVVPPEEHYSAICDLLAEDGKATLGTITNRLGIESKACLWIVSNLVKDGKLTKEGQRYMLPSSK